MVLISLDTVSRSFFPAITNIFNSHEPNFSIISSLIGVHAFEWFVGLSPWFSKEVVDLRDDKTMKTFMLSFRGKKIYQRPNVRMSNFSELSLSFIAQCYFVNKSYKHQYKS